MSFKGESPILRFQCSHQCLWRCKSVGATVHWEQYMKHWRQSRGEVFVYLLQLIVVIVLLIKVLSWGGSQRLISLGVCLLDAACQTPSAALLLWMHVRRTCRSGSSNSNGLLTKSLLYLGEQVMYQFLGKLFICVATWTKSKAGRWTGLLAAFRKCEFEVVTGHEMGSLALAFGRDGWSCTGWILLQCCHECLRKVHQVHSVMSGYVLFEVWIFESVAKCMLLGGTLPFAFLRWCRCTKLRLEWSPSMQLWVVAKVVDNGKELSWCGKRCK